MLYRSPLAEAQFSQGEIFSNLIQVRLDVDSIGAGAPRVIPIKHAFAVMMTQSCDLEADHLLRTGARTSGSLLPSLLFCEAQHSETVQAEIRNSAIWKRVVRNKDDRYHYLRGATSEVDAAGQGTPDLALGFKRYFSIPTDEVLRRLEIGELNRRSCLESPYREHLATRFFYYHLRVALPEDHYQTSSHA